MKNTTEVEKLKKDLETGGFFLNCRIPPGYRTVFPILAIKNGGLCLIFPYLKYQTTGEVDRTLVFPIRYTISVELPAGKIIGFEDLEYREAFGHVDFDKPIGYFRHEEIKKYKKAEYESLYQELMEEYDKVISLLLEGGEYSPSNEKRMSELLSLLTEPFLQPMYRELDRDFYNKYLAEGKVDYGA